MKVCEYTKFFIHAQFVTVLADVQHVTVLEEGHMENVYLVMEQVFAITAMVKEV